MRTEKQGDGSIRILKYDGTPTNIVVPEGMWVCPSSLLSAVERGECHHSRWEEDTYTPDVHYGDERTVVGVSEDEYRVLISSRPVARAITGASQASSSPPSRSG